MFSVFLAKRCQRSASVLAALCVLVTLSMLSACAVQTDAPVVVDETSTAAPVIDLTTGESVHGMPDPQSSRSRESKALVLPRGSRSAAMGAVDQLLSDASEALSADQPGRASALVERALRMAPNDARVYFSLAQVRYQQNELQQSRTLAQKAASLAGDDRKLRQSIEKFANKIASH